MIIRQYLMCALLIGSFSAGEHAWAAPQKTASVEEDNADVLRKARELRKLHKLNEAAALLQKHVATHREDADALSVLAQIQVDEGDNNGAQQLLLQALNASPNSPAANLLAGQMLAEQHQYPQAMDRFETVLMIRPHDGEARKSELDAARQLAAQARAAGNEEAVLKVFEHVREKMPDNPELLLQLGMEAFNLHRLSEAEEALNVAQRLSPKDPDVAYGLARVEIEQQHMAPAEANLRSYLAARPNDASAHFGLGHILAMEQRDDAARAEFNRSIQLQPVQTESYYQIGQLDLNIQQDERSEVLFRKVLSRDPNHGGALVGMGEIAFHAKRYSEADEYLQRAEKAASDYAPAHYYRGLTLARQGKKAEADEELRVAAQLGNTDVR